uniref:MORN repeat protein n=1 Tax=Pithovirus LCPAC201 TaxID=2506591 RepID=A0A481Z8C9_9VIRU|nr:MAG: hypothetical protein LCPAC201_02520 [Pithovirus LCPAC201]
MMNQKPRLYRTPSIRRIKKEVTVAKKNKSPRIRSKLNLIRKHCDLSRRDTSSSIRGGSITVDFPRRDDKVSVSDGFISFNLPPFSGVEKSRRRYHPDGLLLIWHQNGQLWIECDYLDGERFGKFTSWYENGSKSQVSYWAHGLKSGPREMWGKTGKRVVYDYWLGGVRMEEYFNLLKQN